MSKYQILVCLALLVFCERQGFAENNVSFTPKVGVSAMTGVLGAELRYKHVAWDFGFPLSGGVRYYFRPEKHSWFTGLYGFGYGYDHDETKDNIQYKHHSVIEGGAAGGYRWLWKSRWSLELGLGAGYGEMIWTSPTQKRKDTGIYVMPIAAFGIQF